MSSATGRQTAIGIDLGGTKIEGALVRADGEVLASERVPAPAAGPALLSAVAGLVERLSAGAQPLGVGCSIPGSLDPVSGLLRNAPNSPGIEGTPLARDLATRLPGRRLAFENDANCLIKSEQRFGAGRGAEHLVGVILGTGVGCGVISGGRLLASWRGLAPEPGHIPLRSGRACKCGNDGCVEAWLSGPSVLRRYREAGGGLPDTPDLFASDEPLARRIVDETLALFARFVAMLGSIYDPERVILGGGLSLQPAFYQQRERIARHLCGSDQPPEVLRAEGGDASGKLGAAALIFDAP